jgi:hypothetical protein
MPKIKYEVIKEIGISSVPADDIAHHGKVVSALGETIRIMREVDEMIEPTGGWAIK